VLNARKEEEASLHIHKISCNMHHTHIIPYNYTVLYVSIFTVTQRAEKIP